MDERLHVRRCAQRVHLYAGRRDGLVGVVEGIKTRARNEVGHVEERSCGEDNPYWDGLEEI